MRILLVSHAYGPESTPCGMVTWRAALALVAAGAEITVLYSQQFPPPPPVPGITLLPCSPQPSQLHHGLAILSRLCGQDLAHGPWVWRATRLGAAQSADLIYACSSPLASLSVGVALQQRTGIPAVLLFTDAFPPPPEWQPSALARRCQQHTMATLCAAARGFTFLNRQLMAYQERLGGQPLQERSAVIPNIMIPWAALGPRTAGPMPVFLHLGKFYGNRRPEPLVAAFALLLARLPAAELHLAGKYSLAMVAPLLTTEALKHQVHLLGDHVDPLAAMRAADVLICLDGPGREPVYLPSKLSEYLASDRVVLCVTPPNSPTAEMVAGVPGSVLVASHEPTAIARAMAQAAGISWHEALTRQRHQALEAYTSVAVGRRLLTFLDGCRKNANDSPGAGGRARDVLH